MNFFLSPATVLSPHRRALGGACAQEDVDFFQHLEMYMRAENPPLCGRDHLSYRSYYFPVKVRVLAVLQCVCARACVRVRMCMYVCMYVSYLSPQLPMCLVHIHTHTHTLSLSLSHTHTHTSAGRCRRRPVRAVQRDRCGQAQGHCRQRGPHSTRNCQASRAPAQPLCFLESSECVGRCCTFG